MDAKANRASKPIIVNVSNRHIHLHQNEVDILFGKGYQITKLRDLMQTGEYACNEILTVAGKKGEIKKVRVLGPLRKATQVEISLTDSITAGFDAPVRQSGHLAGSAPVKIIGPKGTVDMKEGCIVAMRHVHMKPADADFYGIKDQDVVSVKVEGGRGLVFENVVARVSPNMMLECHLDTDEANAAGAKNGSMAFIL